MGFADWPNTRILNDEVSEAAAEMSSVLNSKRGQPAQMKILKPAGFDEYKQAVELRQHHLQTWAAFILGYDQDTIESVLATCDWGLVNRFTFAAFNVLMPYPTTTLYKRLQSEGRLLYDGHWWLHPAYRFNYAAYRPVRMTPDELTETAWKCRQKWSSPSSIFKRALDLNTNRASLFRFGVYCVYNPLFRREAFKRQGMRLGTV
jgi:hypothetical protein